VRRFALLLGVTLALGAALGCGRQVSGSAVERAITDRYPGQFHSLSCAKDHDVRLPGGEAGVYRCIAHGGSNDGEEVCVTYRDGRLVGGHDLEGVPFTDLSCEDQG
jgi:hypothetical protein